jgi:3-methyladenine DNA glycosylase/8-oxoguanine DNA glycosylase
MRIARDPDVLLADDLGVRRALSRGSALPTPAQVVRRAEAWRPWRAYAVMLLWSDAGARRTTQTRILGRGNDRC